MVTKNVRSGVVWSQCWFSTNWQSRWIGLKTWFLRQLLERNPLVLSVFRLDFSLSCNKRRARAIQGQKWKMEKNKKKFRGQKWGLYTQGLYTRHYILVLSNWLASFAPQLWWGWGYTRRIFIMHFNPLVPCTLAYLYFYFLYTGIYMENDFPGLL